MGKLNAMLKMISIPKAQTFLIIIIICSDIQTTSEHRLDINNDNNKDILQFVRSDNPFRSATPKINDLQRRDYLINNDLDDIYTTKIDSNVMYKTPRDEINHSRPRNNNNNRGGGQRGRGGGGGGGKNRNRDPNQKNHNSIKYNNTVMVPNPSGSDLLNDFNAFRGDKILKSSKNALIVTKKEYLKKDWCKTEPLVQKIREDGCLTKTIINRFCYGQCNSFYIPKSPKRNKRNQNANNIRQQNNEQFEDEDLTGPAFRSCAFCKPKKFAWVTITLRCPSMMPQLRKKRIQRIKQCKCIAEPLN